MKWLCTPAILYTFILCGWFISKRSRVKTYRTHERPRGLFSRSQLGLCACSSQTFTPHLKVCDLSYRTISRINLPFFIPPPPPSFFISFFRFPPSFFFFFFFLLIGFPSNFFFFFFFICFSFFFFFFFFSSFFFLFFFFFEGWGGGG